MIVRILDNLNGTAFVFRLPAPLFVHDAVYFITGNHEESERAASWCSLHGAGEVYRRKAFTLEILKLKGRN